MDAVGGQASSCPSAERGRRQACWTVAPSRHEHSCIRCPVLRVDPAQRGRLEQIRDNLTDRIIEAEREGRLGEADGLCDSLAETIDKLTQPDERARRADTVFLSIPAFLDIASRTLTIAKAAPSGQ